MGKLAAIADRCGDFPLELEVSEPVQNIRASANERPPMLFDRYRRAGCDQATGTRSVSRYRFVRFTDRFSAVIGSLAVAGSAERTEPPDGRWIRWHYMVKGDLRLESTESKGIRLRESTAALHIPPQAGRLGWTYSGSSQRFVTLLMHPEFVADALRCTSWLRGQLLAEKLAGTGEELLSLPPSAAINRTIQGIIDPPFRGTLYNSYLEGKALELLGHSMQAVEERLQKDGMSVALSRRDVATLRDVRAAIMEHPTAWLTITQLSRKFGINQRKLKEGFKRLFGDTVFQFAQEQRMLMAQRLIEEDSVPICHVSSKVGYQSHTSFTAAFKRHFGCLPREARHRARTSRRMEGHVR